MGSSKDFRTLADKLLESALDDGTHLSAMIMIHIFLGEMLIYGI